MFIISQKMLKRISEFEERKVIDPACAKAMSEELKCEIAADKQFARKVVIFNVWALGVFVASLGIRLFTESVWDYLSQFQRTIIAFLPLIISAFVGMRVILKNGGEIARECAALFNIFGAGCAIVVSANIYQIEGSAQNFCFAMFALSLPVAMIFSSGISAAVCAALVCAFAFNNYNSEFIFPSLKIPIFLFSTALLVFWIILVLRRDIKAYVFYPALIILSAIFMPAFLVLIDIHNEFISLSLSMMFFGVLFVLASRTSILYSFIKVVSIIAFCVLMCTAISFGGRGDLSDDFSKLTFSQLSSGIIFSLSCVAAYFILLYRVVREWNFNGIYIAFSLLLPFAFLMLLAAWRAEGIINYIAPAFAFATALYAIYKGVKKLFYEDLNVGILLLFVFSICEFNNTSFSPLVRSTILIGLGVFVVAVNLFVIKRRSNEG